MKRLHFLTILSFITIFSSAEPFCDVRKFSILDGLAANSISDLAQGYDNMMWFGTLNGLSYYDGYHFKTFRDEPDDIDIMSTNRILAIFPSPDNNVWVVTFDRKLYIFDTEQCQFIKVGTMLCKRFGIHFGDTTMEEVQVTKIKLDGEALLYKGRNTEGETDDEWQKLEISDNVISATIDSVYEAVWLRLKK